MFQKCALLLALIFLAIACSSETAPAPTGEPEPTAVEASPPSPPSPAQAPGDVDSTYTEIDGESCRVTLEEEPPSSLLECPGPSGYALEVSDADARVEVAVLVPGDGADDRGRPLEIWRTITGGFSSIGPRAEWRVTGGLPTAMIVRVNAYEHPDDPDKTTSYLTVTKITPDATCVVAKVPPSAEQNVEARKIADASAGMGCL